ncbi:MAG TPA: acetate--CoA ligase family protein [Trebonia sp.]
MMVTSPGAVGALVRPSSIALVGATDKSGWSVNTHANLRGHAFAGPVYLVNRRGGTVHGERAYPSLSAIGAPVDLAYVMVPAPAVLGVLREGAALGIRGYVVLTAGFGETGPEGRQMEEEITRFAAARGLTILGPNGNGFVNAAAGITPFGLAVPPPLLAGPVGVVLQSGGLASSVLSLAQARNVGLSLLTAVGNEAMISVTDVMSYLVDDPGTKVIALFLESVRHPGEFASVCRRAARAGKPVVALKVGASARAASTARAHTGALTGDDRVTDTVFRRLGVIRVRSLEDLVITAGLLAETSRIGGRRIGVVTPSGGASEIIADRAELEGLELPSFHPETVRQLKEFLPEFAAPQNPLDVTGYILIDTGLLARALGVVARDPGIDAVLLLTDPPRAEPANPAPIIDRARATALAIREAPLPVMAVSNALTDVTEFGRRVLSEAGFPYVAGGIEHGMTAVGNAVRWSESTESLGGGSHLGATAGGARAFGGRAPGRPGEVWAEHRAARLLADSGIPVVPAELAAGEEDAVAAAGRFGYPVVLKATADGLGHKSDIGGVRLGLNGPEAVRRAHREVTATLRARGLAADGLGGTLIQPQRDGGTELLVGVVRDPSWGLVMAVGLGGVWVEALGDTALRLLPVTPEQARDALAELRGAALLDGARGDAKADMGKLAEVIARIGDAALALGPRLAALEVNPLLVRGGDIEALDALITWQ